MASNAHPHFADLLNLAREATEQEVFCFLLGEKPKMATNAHHVSQIYTIHINSLAREGTEQEVFLFSFIRKIKMASNAHPRFADLLNLAREETEQEDFLFSFRRKTQDGDQCTPTCRIFTQYTLHLPREATETEDFLFSFRRKTQDGDQCPRGAADRENNCHHQA